MLNGIMGNYTEPIKFPLPYVSGHVIMLVISHFLSGFSVLLTMDIDLVVLKVSQYHSLQIEKKDDYCSMYETLSIQIHSHCWKVEVI